MDKNKHFEKNVDVSSMIIGLALEITMVMTFLESTTGSREGGWMRIMTIAVNVCFFLSFFISLFIMFHALWGVGLLLVLARVNVQDGNFDSFANPFGGPS